MECLGPERVVDTVRTDRRSSEGDEVGADTEMFAQVMNERSNVRSLRARNTEADVPPVLPNNREFTYGYASLRPVDQDSLPSELVESLALDLDGGIHGRRLHQVADEMGSGFDQIRLGNMLCRPPILYRCFGIKRSRRFTESEYTLVLLVAPDEVLDHSRRRSSDAADEQARSHGVERARMADPSDAGE